MNDWNVVITVYQDGYRRALRALRNYGAIEHSPYHNVLVMKVDDPLALLDDVERCTEEMPALYDAISRIAPAQHSFDFTSAAELNDKAANVVTGFMPQLAGKSFHVRIHRRGERHGISTPDIERRLDEVLLDALRRTGAPGRIAFDDPDAVITLDTIERRAGLSLWTRADLARHRLLRPD